MTPLTSILSFFSLSFSLFVFFFSLQVKGSNSEVIGSRKGAELAFSTISFLPNTAAVVIINGCVSNTATALTYGSLILTGLPFNLDKIAAIDSGVYDVNEALEDPWLQPTRKTTSPSKKLVPISILSLERTTGFGRALFCADMAVKHLTEHEKTNFTFLSQPNSDHLIAFFAL